MFKLVNTKTDGLVVNGTELQLKECMGKIKRDITRVTKTKFTKEVDSH